MKLSDLLNKSQKYAEAVIKSCGWKSVILSKDGVSFPPPNDYDQYRVGLIIVGGFVKDYKIG